MAKARSVVSDYTVYLLVRVIVCTVQALSFPLAQRLARGLAWLVYHLDRRHRQVAMDNLELAFPGRYTEARRDALVREVYRHFCTVLIEIIHLPRLINQSNWRNLVEVAQNEQVMHGLVGDRPLLIVTGHLGNWELAGYILGLFGFSPHAVARPLDNPFLDRFFRSFRERTGQGILAKHGDFDRLEGILRGRGIVATLGDQDAGQRGLFVEFFGRPASTHKAIALLALEHRVAMVVVGVPRIHGRYHIVTADAIFPEEYENHPDAVRAITQRFTTALESLVRRYPEQYFWLHRRWKHQPAVRKKKQPGGQTTIENLAHPSGVET